MTWRDSYFENRILTANPVELVCLLYEKAISCVQEARRQLQRGDIGGRSSAICRAIDIVAELEASLDHGSGGSISANLAELYCYIRRRLTAGNMKQQDAPLAEAEALLMTLAVGWKAASETPVEPPQSSSPQPNPVWQPPSFTEHTWHG